MNSSEKLTEFLSGSGTDDRGRRISEIIGWSNGQLESCHDYIQWVFPNQRRSRFNPDAPVWDEDTIGHIKSCPAAIQNIRRFLMRIYSFYSFEIVNFEDGSYQLDLSEDGVKPWWVSPNNHNFLRLTRILQTLKDLDLQDDLFALSDILDVLTRKYPHIIGEKTIRFWREVGYSG